MSHVAVVDSRQCCLLLQEALSALNFFDLSPWEEGTNGKKPKDKDAPVFNKPLISQVRMGPHGAAWVMCRPAWDCMGPFAAQVGALHRCTQLAGEGQQEV